MPFQDDLPGFDTLNCNNGAYSGSAAQLLNVGRERSTASWHLTLRSVLYAD